MAAKRQVHLADDHSGFDDTDWGPAPPSKAELDFDEEVGVIACRFQSIANQTDQVGIADTMEGAIGLFHDLRRSRRLSLLFTEHQRNQLFNALATARGHVHRLPEPEQADAEDALCALQALANHYGRDFSQRRLPEDRQQDLIAHSLIGQNTLRTMCLQAAIELRAARRNMSTLAYVEGA